MPYIQFISDLHLEDQSESGPLTFNFEQKADNLALLGDIATTVDTRLFDWLRVQLERFETVIFIAGNHEHYDSTLEESEVRLRSFAEQYKERVLKGPGRFIFLNRSRYDISPTVSILGCTLWSKLETQHLDAIVAGVQDFSRIVDFSPATTEALHTRDFEWLKRSVAELRETSPERRIIVMTHHAPTIQGTSATQYVGGPRSSAFATEIIDSDTHRGWAEWISIWMFGHTHWNCDFERAGVRVLSNQRGYRVADNFNPEMVVQLPS